jgi:hypothetical protein
MAYFVILNKSSSCIDLEWPSLLRCLDVPRVVAPDEREANPSLICDLIWYEGLCFWFCECCLEARQSLVAILERVAFETGRQFNNLVNDDPKFHFLVKKEWIEVNRLFSTPIEKELATSGSLIGYVISLRLSHTICSDELEILSKNDKNVGKQKWLSCLDRQRDGRKMGKIRLNGCALMQNEIPRSGSTPMWVALGEPELTLIDVKARVIRSLQVVWKKVDQLSIISKQVDRSSICSKISNLRYSIKDFEWENVICSKSFCSQKVLCEHRLGNFLINANWMECRQEHREITITPAPKRGQSMHIKGYTVSNEGIHSHYAWNKAIRSWGSHTRRQRQMWQESSAPVTLRPNTVDILIMLSAGPVVWCLTRSDPRFP